MNALSYLQNKVLATAIRYMVGKPLLTHEDEVLEVPSRDASRIIKVNAYYAKKQNKPEPVLINFHGSGWVIPMHGSDDEYALQVRASTTYTILDVQYRLSPEYPYPAATHDAEDVVKWVLSQSERFARSHISVSGFSAGGNLALGLSGLVFPKDTFRHLLAFYPPTDMSRDPSTKVAPDTSGKPLPDWMANSFNACYAPPPIDRAQPRISPSYIDGSAFPQNVLIITCALDNLAPEAESLVQKIRAVPGKYVVHKRMEQCNHAWDKDYEPGTVQEKAKIEAYDMAATMLQR